MAAIFKLEIITPERVFFQDDVEMLIVKTREGEMGVLGGHIPIVVAVDIGVVKFQKEGEWKVAAINEGFMEVTQDYTIIFTDTAEWPDEIDLERAENAKKRAEKIIEQNPSEAELWNAKLALARANARIKAVKGKNES